MQSECDTKRRLPSSRTSFTYSGGSIRNSLEVICLATAFAGHYHDGGYQLVNGIHYVTLQASAAYGDDASCHNQ
jgi:hypothetical protein